MLTLHIARLDTGFYEAWPMAGGVEVARANHYPSIEESIRAEATAVPGPFASELVEILYADLSSGTLTLQEAIEQAAAIADRFALLAAISEG